MPAVRNLTDLIQAQSCDTVLRTVILHDMVKDDMVYSQFHHHYDSDPSISAIAQLFDQSFQVVKSSSQTVQDENTLPLLNYIGRWHVTLVTKSLTGMITCTDATRSDVDTYLGLGG